VKMKKYRKNISKFINIELLMVFRGISTLKTASKTASTTRGAFFRHFKVVQGSCYDLRPVFVGFWP
jgi:hypothetical protein